MDVARASSHCYFIGRRSVYVVPSSANEIAGGNATFGLVECVTTTTGVLERLGSGRGEALDRLMPLVYRELRAIAHQRLAARGGGGRGGPHGTLVTTALVHEAYL